MIAHGLVRIGYRKLAERLVEAWENEEKAHPGHVLITPDGKFSVEFVECLASCGTAPVMMCNEDFYEGVTHQKADEIVGKCR